jgi:hypothetical protein
MITTIGQLVELKSRMMLHLDVKHRQFSYALERNIERCVAEIKKAQRRAYQHPSFMHNDDFDKFYAKFNKLNNELGSRDEGKNLLFDEKGYVIPTDAALYAEKLRAIEEEHPIGSGVFSQRKMALDSIYDEQVDIKIYAIDKDSILPEAFSMRDRLSLRFMFSGDLLPEAITESEEAVKAPEVKEETEKAEA